MKMSVIVPLYFDNIELYQVIHEFFDTLGKTGPNIDLVVIDDGSPMDTSSFPVTKRVGQNRGYTASVNEGLKLATGDILVVANDDLIFKPGDLDWTHYITSNNIVSPKTTDEGSGDRFGSLWGMSRKVYEKLGSLNEELKHYFSDLDYYQRALEEGVLVLKVESAVVEHVGGATYKADKSLYLEDMKRYAERWGRVD